MADLTWNDTPSKCQAQFGSLLFCVENKPDGWECVSKTRSGELEILARKLPTASAGKQVVRQRLADAEKQSGKKTAKRVKPAEGQNDGDDRYQEAQPHLVDISDGCVCGYVNGVRWVADQKGKIVFLKAVSDAVRAQVEGVVKQHLARRRAKPADVPATDESTTKTPKKAAKKAAKTAAKTAAKKDCGCEHPVEGAEEKKTAKVVSKKGASKKAASKVESKKAAGKKAEGKKAASKKAASKKAASKKPASKKPEGKSVDTPAKKPPIRPDSAPKQTEDAPLDAKVLAAMTKEPIKMAELLKTIKGAAKADVAQSVKRLVAAGQVQVSGRTRGTQYSLAGAAPTSASKKSGKKAVRKKSEDKKSEDKDEEDAPAPSGSQGALRWNNVEGRRQAATSEGSWQIMPEGSSFSLYYLNPSGASRFIETGEVGKLEQIAGERHARGAMGEAPRSMSAVERLFNAELNN